MIGESGSYGKGLPRRRLGRSGLMVPAIGLGGAWLGGRSTGAAGDTEAVATVHDALEQGINYIDTSPLYGESERRIGLALDGVRRQDVIISTKTGTHPQRRGDYSWDGTLWSIENSLRLLKLDYIDLLLVHDPGDMAPVMAERGALEALEYLRGQGVIRHTGLGLRRHDFHRLAIESCRFDVILTFGDYSPIRTSAADWLLPLAAAHDIGVLNGSPLLTGLLVGQDPDTMSAYALRHCSPGEKDAVRRFYHWCIERELSMVNVVFQFCLRQPLIHCTLTGASTRAELHENLRAATTALPDSIWDELAALELPPMQG